MSIASQIQLLAQNKAAIKAAIEAKFPATAPGDALADWPASIASIPSGSGGVDEKKPVRFYDYDGTLLYSYTAEEAQALTEMPTVPVVEGRTSQGWNYTLAQMKATLTAMGSCDVGHNSLLTGDTAVIRAVVRDQYATSVKIGVGLSGNPCKLVIDWGDGSSQERTSAGAVSPTHIYSPEHFPQEYEIRVTRVSGVLAFDVSLAIGDSATATQTSFGSRILSFDACASQGMVVGGIFRGFDIESVSLTNDGYDTYNDYAWFACSELKHLSCQRTLKYIGTHAFEGCVSMQTVSLPPSLLSIGDYAFSQCSALKSLVIPTGVTSIGTYAFERSGITSAWIPSSVTSIGTNAFEYCASLRNLHFMANITSVGNYMFSYCCSLQPVVLPGSVTSIGNYAFEHCISLKEINLPSGITSIGRGAFRYCYKLEKINIPSGVTVINTTLFSYCSCLESLVFPSGLASISTNAFTYCYALKVFDFSACTSVPTLSSTNAFGYTSNSKKIVVPDDLYDEWVAASNWSSTTNNIKTSIIKKSDFDNL